MSKPSPHSDEAILAAVRDNPTTGWELCCTQYEPLIRAIVHWSKWNFTDEVRQDIGQNIRVHLHTALPRFRQESSLAWYIKKIAMNQCISEVRRQRRTRSLMTSTFQKTADGIWKEMEFANPDAPDPYYETGRKEIFRFVHTAVQTLNSTCRDGISMFYMQQLSYQEMSERLGIAVNTVGSRLSKCLDKLHNELRRDPAFKGI